MRIDHFSCGTSRRGDGVSVERSSVVPPGRVPDPERSSDAEARAVLRREDGEGVGIVEVDRRRAEPSR